MDNCWRHDEAKGIYKCNLYRDNSYVLVDITRRTMYVLNLEYMEDETTIICLIV